MLIYLECLSYSVELPEGDTVIGRDVSCALRFNDPKVSRQHVRITRRGDEVSVDDLGSTNGTVLNGDPLRGHARLGDGDTLVLGGRGSGGRILQLHFRDEASEQPSTRRLAKLADLSAIASKPKDKPGVRRCPRCTAECDATSRECSVCNYRWASYRPTVPNVAIPTGVDRRRQERHAVELPIVYTSSELEIEAASRDLSMSGMFVRSQVLEPIGTRCTLTILLDEGPPLRLRGIVRRVVEREVVGGEPVGLGIEFFDLGSAERGWLEVAIGQTRATEAIERIDP